MARDQMKGIAMFIFVQTSHYIVTLYQAFIKSFPLLDAKGINALLVIDPDAFYITDDVEVETLLTRDSHKRYLMLRSDRRASCKNSVYKYETMEVIFRHITGYQVEKVREVLFIASGDVNLSAFQDYVLLPLQEVDVEATTSKSLYDLEYSPLWESDRNIHLKVCSSLRPYIYRNLDDRKILFERIARNIVTKSLMLYMVRSLDSIFTLAILERIDTIYCQLDDKSFEVVSKTLEGVAITIIRVDKKKKSWLKGRC